MRNRIGPRGFAVACVVFSLSGAAMAGPSDPIFSMTVAFNAQVLRFAPAEPEYYSLFASADVSGFTEAGNANNRVRVMSDNGHFEGETTPGGSGSTSAGFATFNELYGAITDGTAWSVEVRDGATGLLYNYAFSVDGSGLAADHMRPTTITSHVPGQSISSSPTFDWMVPPASDPGLEYTDATALLLGTGGFYAAPGVAPGATTWTPDGPISPGTYTFIVTSIGVPAPGALFTPTDWHAVGGAPELASFQLNSIFSSYAHVSDLVVVPAPGALALAGLAGAVGARRRSPSRSAG